MRRFPWILVLLALPVAVRAADLPIGGASPQQRFARANAAADGHLTLEEAQAGFPLVARHFAGIDIDGKGYVTLKDLRAWYAARRVAGALPELATSAGR
jgi:hypothetical protein